MQTENKSCMACETEMPLEDLEMFPYYNCNWGVNELALIYVCKKCMKDSSHPAAKHARKSAEMWLDFIGSPHGWMQETCTTCGTALTWQTIRLLPNEKAGVAGRCKKCFQKHFDDMREAQENGLASILTPRIR